MFGTLWRLWWRQTELLGNINYLILYSHLFMMSLIMLFFTIRIWSTSSDNAEMYSMSGRGEVWMNGDPHLWLTLTGHGPLRESFYDNIYISNNNNNNYISRSGYISNSENKIEFNNEISHSSNIDDSRMALPHLLQEYEKLYRRRMAAIHRRNIKTIVHDDNDDESKNANNVHEQQEQEYLWNTLPIPVAAVMVQGAEITPAIAKINNFYGERLISAYRFALLSGAPWLLITCHSEHECHQGLHFLLTNPNIADTLFSPYLLKVMTYPKNETGTVLRDSLLSSNTLQEWMWRGEVLDSLPCSFNTRNKFVCLRTHIEEQASQNMPNTPYNIYNQYTLSSATTFATKVDANSFMWNDHTQENIDANEKLAYELIETYESEVEENLLSHEREQEIEIQEEEEQEEEEEEISDVNAVKPQRKINSENNFDTITVTAHHRNVIDAKHKKEDEVKELSSVVTPLSVHNSEYDEEEEQEEEEEEQEELEEEDNTVVTVEFVHSNNHHQRKIHNANVKENDKKKSKRIMKAYYPRYIVHKGIRFIQPGIVMVQHNTSSETIEPTVDVLQSLIEMNAAEHHKMWRINKYFEKKSNEGVNNVRYETRNKHTNYKHNEQINKGNVAREQLTDNINVIDKSEMIENKSNHSDTLLKGNKKTMSKEHQENYLEEHELLDNNTVVRDKNTTKYSILREEQWQQEHESEPWWWWLNEDHVVLVVTSVGEQKQAKLRFTKALRDVGLTALTNLQSLIAKLMNERQNELFEVKNTESNIDKKQEYMNNNSKVTSNIEVVLNNKSNKILRRKIEKDKHSLLLSSSNIHSSADILHTEDIHLPFAATYEYTKLFVLRPYISGNVELFTAHKLLPFDRKLPENIPEDCSWLARKLGVYSYYIYRNYEHFINEFISFSTSTGGYMNDINQLNVLTSDYKNGRISFQDVDFYE